MNSSEQAIEEARRAGIDIDLLDTIQALTPEERCRHHDAALKLILDLEAAREARDAKLRSTAEAAR